MDVPGGSPLPFGVAVAGCVAAPVAVAADAPDPVRALAVLALVVVAPGLALLGLISGRGARPSTGLTVGLSLAISVLVAQACLLVGGWAPEIATYVLAGASLVGLAVAAGVRRPRTGRWLRLSASGSGRRFRAGRARAPERVRVTSTAVSTGAPRGRRGAAR